MLFSSHMALLNRLFSVVLLLFDVLIRMRKYCFMISRHASFIVCFSFFVACQRLHAESRLPNVLFLCVDDLGWRDIGYAGQQDFRTPHMDRIAREGMHFDQAHAAAPICSASRAALLSGRSPARLHYEFVPKNSTGRPQDKRLLQAPDYPTELESGLPTVATILRNSGYDTAFFGKWHLNRHHKTYLGWLPGHGPESFGFSHCIDRFGSHPYGYLGKMPEDLSGDAFPRDSLIDEAVDFLSQPRSKPFLLWMSFYQVHDPFHSPCKDRVAWHQSRLDQGRSPKLAQYAAMVETLDHQVGCLLEVLENQGLSKDTIVILTSDNGGHPEVSSLAPLRGSKWNLYQGGVRVPLAIRWPGTVKAGVTCQVPVIGMDLAATILEVANLPADQVLDGRSLLPCLKGKTDDSWFSRPLFWHFPYYHPEERFDQAKSTIGVADFVISRSYPHAALRIGNDKLLYFFETGNVELYDLSRDPSESKDLSKLQEEKVSYMRRLLLSKLRDVNARMPKRKESP